MKQTFTASEVRRTACEWPAWRVGDMLHAFADLLEAREKAVPMAWMVSDDGWNQCFTTLDQCRMYGKEMIPLYTHPAPSDAERLAEALEIIDGWMELYDHQGTGSSRDASRSEKEWAADRAKLSWLLGAQAQKEVE